MNIGKLLYSKKKSPVCRQSSFFGGLILIIQDYQNYTKTVKFLDKVILVIKINGAYKELTLFSKLKFQYKRNIPVLNKVLKKLPSGIDDIYICKHHIGEIYIFCQLLDEYIKVNKSKNPLLIIPEKRYITLYNMFCPNINKLFINLNPMKLDRQICNDVTNYKGHRFFVPIPDRFTHLRSLIFDNDSHIHFYDYMKEKMGIKEKIASFKPASISDKTKEKVYKHAKQIGLNLDKFVIFIPEAVTATELSETFWIKLGNYFASQGYQIYVNTSVKKSTSSPENLSEYSNWENKIPNAILDFTSFDEIYYLAELSKCVVALVNGLVVNFAQINVPRYFIYSNQTKTIGDRMDADLMLNAYRLDYLPGCNTKNLYEINLNEKCEKDTIQYIISTYNNICKETF